MFVDTHCHISTEYYDSIDSVINENKEAGAFKTVISGCDFNGIKESLNIIHHYSDIYATIGYHPDEVSRVDADSLMELEKIIKRENKIVGVGEIGLDYHYDKENRDKQIELFRSQLEIASHLQMPVVVHSRDATFDTIQCLKDYSLKGVIHCFSGSLEVANIYIKMGFKLGIGGVVTFKNSKLGEVVKEVGLSNIVLETDSPYLTPEPYRGKINSSKYIPYIASYIASLLGCSIDEVFDVTTKNAIEIFKF